MRIEACIFDLDGVLVDTAKYHFIAWKKLADDLGIVFNEQHNELLKGVSRMRSLDIILELGKKNRSEAEKQELAESKNKLYQSFIEKMTEDEVLPGAISLLENIKSKGIKIALGSASKNAPIILEKVGIDNYFDAVVDGNQVTKAKPDPEVFSKGAELLGVNPFRCIVFEDAEAGVQAAKNAGMLCVGIGSKAILEKADWVYSGLNAQGINQLIDSINTKSNTA